MTDGIQKPNCDMCKLDTPHNDDESEALKEIRVSFAELERMEKHLAAFREVMKL